MSSQPDGSRSAQIATMLQGILGRVLRIEPGAIDIEAPFLELGADSLALVEALRGIQETFGVKMTIRQLFEQVPTIAALAGYLEQASPHPPAPSPAPPAPLPGRGGDLPEAPVAAAPPIQAPPAQVAAPPPVVAAPIAPAAPLFSPLPGRGDGGAGEGPGVRASSGLEKVLGLQIQAFNQLVAQQLQMLGARAPHPPAPSPIPSRPPGEGGTGQVASSSFLSPGTGERAGERGDGINREGHQRPVLPTHLGKVAKGPELTDRQRAHLDALVARYVRKTAKSKELTQRYRPWLADSRATVGFRPQVKEMLYPLARARSKGSRLWDIDGNEYIDVTMGMGVHLLGHAPDFLQEVIEAQVREGFELGPRSAHSGEVAKLFCELTGMERATFTNSGTEAVMTAIRLARARTGRTKIAMFAGSYHGHSDGTLAQSREVDGEVLSFPVAPGIPPKVAEEVMVLEYGTDHSLEILRRHARELAAVIVEPIQSRRPDLQPAAFLHELRRLTAESGVALIFDEMICGFRLHLGGGQAHFGIRADLATYGKIVGGGLPIGVVAGSADYMDGIDGGLWQYGDDSRPERDTTFFGGTFCQHPLAMSAARVVLTYLKEQGPALQETLNARTARFAGQLDAWLQEEKLPFRVVSAHSLFRFQGSGNLELLYYHLVEKGVYVWEWRNCFLSTAHTDADLDTIVRAVQESVAELRQGGFLPEKPAPSDGGGGGGQVGSWERKGIKPAIAPVHGGAAPSPKASVDPDRGVDFSLYFFGNYTAEFRAGKYDLILDAARFADRAGLTGLWFPERHFHPFGGLSPNPSVLAAALARETERIALRAGSVVLPLHHPVRVAEEWALVDNLSGGRVGLSYASGWHPNDFALAPENYGRHRELMFERGETIQRLWRGETVRLRDGAGSDVDLRVYPLPARRDLPVWITIVNNPDTYRLAGEMGAGVLTNLMGQTPESLAANLEIYREALARAGHPPSAGHVTLLLHTFLGPDAAQAVDTARRPFYRYLESSVGLVKNAVASEGMAVDFDRLSPEDMEYMLELAYQRYVRTAALVGSPESVAPVVESLRALGVDEIACLVDFGVDPALVQESLPWIAALQKRFRARRRPADAAPLRVLLTEAQRDLWTVTQLGPEASLAYLEAGVLELRGPLDVDLFRRAHQQVVDRHEAVRTILPVPGPGEEPFQEVLPELELQVPLIDLTGLPEGRREEAAQQWLEAESHRRFDLARGPLIRATLLRVEPRVHRLGFYVHHIAADGLSIVILLTEALAVYEAGRAGRRAALREPLQFREYAEWLAAGGAETPEDEPWWLEALAGELPVFEPPTDRPRPAVRTFRGDRRRRVLPKELDRRLREVSRKQGSTFFIGLLAAWSALLHRWTGQDDVVIGGPTARRPLEGGDRLVGHCVDLVPYRSRISGDREPTFAEHITALRRFVFASHEHGGYPVARLLRKLGLAHDPSRAPLINAVFNLDPGPGITRAAGLELAERSPAITHAKFDVALHVLEAGGEVVLYLDYLRDLFDPPTIDRLLGHLVTLVEGVAADPARPLGDLPLLTESELRQVVEEWNRTDTNYPRNLPVHVLFDEVAERAPEAPAVVQGEEVLTYGELRDRADQMARHLRTLGVGPEVPVVLDLERSPELVIAMLAVLKAGGFYVPLDPADPSERRAFILGDVNAPVRIGGDPHPLASSPGRARSAEVNDPLALACVIYTSGSTGRPKGVAIPHRGIVRLVNGTDYIHLGPEDRMAHVSNTAFDASTFEIYGALLNGAALVVIPRGVTTVPAALGERLRQDRITATLLITPVLNEVVREAPEGLAGLRWLVTGGDAASPEHLREALARGGPDLRLVNAYGPTESTVIATTWRVEPDFAGRVPIGRPIANTQAYVLDRFLRPVPPGTPGELCLGGDGLARGYLGRPDLTAERFVPSPFEPGARLYRTGDLVRLRGDGLLDFLGRTDAQVKIRGFRVEPGEIEAALASLPGVREAAVVLREGVGGRRLAGFVVMEGGEGSGVRDLLADRLPGWMVPSSLTVLESFPRTPSGKVDRRALARLEAAPLAPEEVFEAPRTPVEEMVAAAWADVLQLDRVGLRDDFFALGGHSLLAGRVLSRLRGSLGVELTLTDFFRTPTVAGLARRAEEARRSVQGRQAPPLVRVPRDTPLRLSFAQERLWLIDQLRPGSAAYNSFLAVRLSGHLDRSALERSLAEIVRRHEVLRTRFVPAGEGPVQVIDPFAPPPLPCADLGGLPEEPARAESRRLTVEEGARPFDLARGPLFRPVLLRLAPEEHLLLLGLHHSVCDGWSLQEVFTSELSTLYRAFREGRPSPLPELPVQYADFAWWQRQWLQGEVLDAELAWWKESLGGEPPALDLPTDHPRPPVPGGRGAARTMVLAPELVDRLVALGRREGITLFMILTAGLQALLHRWSGQDRICLGTPIANRPRTEVEGLIGFFINTLVLSADFQGNPTVRELLGQVRERTLGAFDHQDLPFEKLVAAVQTRRDPSRNPLFQVLLVLQNNRPNEVDLPGLTLAVLPPVSAASLFDLAVSVAEADGALQVVITYATDLFEAPTIERLLASWRHLLEALTEDPERRVDDLPLLHEPPVRLPRLPELPAAQPAAAEPAPPREDLGERRRQLASRRSQLAPERLALLKKWVGGKAGGETDGATPLPPVEVSPLVEIRPAAVGSRPPLFVLHPANGHSNSYLALARHLAPDLPLYALQSPGLTGGALHTGMDAIANAYLEAIRSVQPQGPYRLGGWCVGGTFAYELARRLRAQGEEIELLVLVDSHAPEPEPQVPNDEVDLLASLAREIAAAAGKSLEIPLDELRRIPAEERLGWIVDTARKLEILPDSFSPEQARWHWDVFRANVRAVESYRPERQPLRAVLFRATRQIHEAEGKPSLGWARWITGRLEVVSVEGDHWDAVREPAVETVARGISERLAPATAAAAAQ